MELKIDNIKVRLQEDEILNEVSLDVKDGEFISLLGASGCGKTTLLKSIAGLLDVNSGTIMMGDKDVTSVPPEKRGAVIVFQDLRLFPHMTVEKNITFPMELAGKSKSEQNEMVQKLLEAVQLPGYEKRKIKRMSGGQQQRIALARALAAEPRILLLDEPFSGLDEKLRLEMGALVRKLHKEWKITTILVTHDKREALQMSDRIALMSEGRILQYDTPQNMFYKPVSREVADYFGKANYVSVKVSAGHFDLLGKTVATDKEDGAYSAMVRPFELEILPNGGDGIVSDVVFMGEMAEIAVETADGVILAQMMSDRVKELKIGEKVGVLLKNSQVTLF